ncbi:hypothetical protein FOA43_002929 [Brettanomyces nanus]|uniref:tRNA-intron lyase n=1 Tax=Eeniella nana TaxID=13502 RepID=A0A875S3U9_EENNA|nr:uncharacterized protein FOA43_002929 [Brettanomyces nanus]QPG75573.1 hypothetical protein FOA43_002929 [Brettanomyces nanus]
MSDLTWNDCERNLIDMKAQLEDNLGSETSVENSPAPMLCYSSSCSDTSVPSSNEEGEGVVEEKEGEEVVEEKEGEEVVEEKERFSESPPLLLPSGTIVDDSLRGHDPESMIPILVIGNRALMFNLDHIKHLRIHHGIVGLLSGSLPLAPQQNTLLGLPLALSIDEVLYLLYNGVCYLVDGAKAATAFLDDLVCDEDKLDEMATIFSDDVDNQRAERQREYEERLCKLGLGDKIVQRNDRNKTVFVQTRDNDGLFGALHVHLRMYRDNVGVQKLLLSKLLRMATNEDLDTIYQNFRVFNYLKMNYHHCILPGVRFGGKFVSYPGDPLRYHSHLIVDTRDYYNEDIGMLDISNRGRLATGVKKLWLVCGQRRRGTVPFSDSNEKINELADPEQSSGYRLVSNLFDYQGKGQALKDTETVCFSIEWSGFG